MVLLCIYCRIGVQSHHIDLKCVLFVASYGRISSTGLFPLSDTVGHLGKLVLKCMMKFLY